MKKSKLNRRGYNPNPTNPQLFDDTSFSTSLQTNQDYGNQLQQIPPQYSTPFPIPGQEFWANPAVTNMAMQYGTNIMGQGTDMVSKNVQKAMATSKVKYYFAVDNSYVGKKLLLLLCPFTQKEWAVRYDNNEPVPPRDDLNAPDLYIPLMALVTFILIAGISLGTQGRFTPEQLGTQASTVLGWLLLEILALSFSLYVMNLQTSLRYLDIVAYAGYKHVGMILSVCASVLFQRAGYYAVLAWCSAALAFFLIRTLKLQILLHHGDSILDSNYGNKRRLYLLLIIAGSQPFFMWLLTRGVVV